MHFDLLAIAVYRCNMNVRAETVPRFLIAISALAALMQLNCVKHDLALSDIVGTYSSPMDYAGTRLELRSDHSFVWENWSCLQNWVVRGRWDQGSNGLLTLSWNPAPAKPDAAVRAEQEEEQVPEICNIDPQACTTIRLDQIRLRSLGDSLEFRLSPRSSDALKLPRVR